MRHGDSSQFLPVAKTATGEVYFHEIVNYGQFLIGTAGIVLKLDAPDSYLASRGYECVFDNETTGYSFLSSPDGFPAGRGLIPVPPGGRVRLEAGYQSDLATMVWHVQGGIMGEPWKTYTPTVTCSGMTAPTEANRVCKYKAKDGLMQLDFYVESADGGGATANITISPPFTLPLMDKVFVPFECWVKIGSAAAVRKVGYVDLNDTTAANRVITVIAGTLTDDEVIKVWGSLWCPYVEDWDVYVPTVAWSGGAGAGPGGSPVATYIYREIDGIMHVLLGNYTTDGDNGTNAPTNVSFTMPFPTIDDYDLAKMAAIGIVNINSVWTNNNAYVVGDGLAAARLATFDTAFLYVNAQVAAAYIAVRYPLPSSTTSYDLEDACVWGSTPEDVTYTSRFKLMDGDRMYWSGEIAIADTNSVAVSSLTILPPVPPRKHAKVNIRVVGNKLNNTTWAAASAYLDCNQADPDNRLLRFDALGTYSASVANGLRFEVVYEI